MSSATVHRTSDDFGKYDILAVDCLARTFPLAVRDAPPLERGASPATRAAEQARKETHVLLDAMTLHPPPPIVAYPFEEGTSDHDEGR